MTTVVPATILWMVAAVFTLAGGIAIIVGMCKKEKKMIGHGLVVGLIALLILVLAAHWAGSVKL